MLGRVIDLLPSYMLRRLAKAGGKWDRTNYAGGPNGDCPRCIVGHAANCVFYGQGWSHLAETRLLKALSGHDGVTGMIGGFAERVYVDLSVRFGDERVGRAIEKRAARILADRAAERDLQAVEEKPEPVHA